MEILWGALFSGSLPKNLYFSSGRVRNFPVVSTIMESSCISAATGRINFISIGQKVFLQLKGTFWFCSSTSEIFCSAVILFQVNLVHGLVQNAFWNVVFL